MATYRLQRKGGRQASSTGGGTFLRTAPVLIVLVAGTLTGCAAERRTGGTETARVVSSPSCPSFAEVEEMESEQLNHIPRECDENVPVPSDQPGVSSENWEDPDGDSTIDTVTRFVTPPFQADGQLAAADDQDWTGLEWTGGSFRVQLTGLSSDLDIFVLDEDFDMLGSSKSSGVTSEDTSVNLPAGTYYVIVQPKDEHQDPKARYHVSIVGG